VFAVERHRQLVSLLDIQASSQVVDLGCGRGDTLMEIAPRLGPDGSLVGVDSRTPTAPSSLSGDDRLQLLTADLAGPLPFEGEAFDRAVCHNVLECLVDPDAFVADVWRVLRPGGLFVLGHTDFDTIVFTSEDLALTRLLVHCYCDTTQKWMSQSVGTMGRQLAGIVAGSAFETERVMAWVNVLTSLEPGSPGHEAAHAVANIGRRSAAINNDAIDRWLAGLQSLALAGSFLYGCGSSGVTAKARDLGVFGV
jgi:ubiquinone/menaquinone biosynthesis C-methylase UbiE